MKQKFKHAYMDVATRFAQLSTAKRLQVGAIVVKDDRIISIGYNGLPSGWDNNCEYKDWMPEDAGSTLSLEQIEELWPFVEYSDVGQPGVIIGRYRLKSKPEVLHAETNAISKLAKSSESGADAAIFITHSPCIDCAKMIFQAGITEVYYNTEYRSSDGIDFLKKCRVHVEQIK